jgi:hypothetical protein
MNAVGSIRKMEQETKESLETLTHNLVELDNSVIKIISILRIVRDSLNTTVKTEKVEQQLNLICACIETLQSVSKKLA